MGFRAKSLPLRIKPWVEPSGSLSEGLTVLPGVLLGPLPGRDKYDVEKHKDLNIAGDDAFARLYASVESDIEVAIKKADTASNEKSRASAVAMNAEIRRTKARLLEEVPKLQRLALKRVKGLSTEDLAARNDLVLLCLIEFKPYQMELQLLPKYLGVINHQLLAVKSNLTQMEGLMMNTSNKLRSQVSLGKSMKCRK